MFLIFSHEIFKLILVKGYKIVAGLGLVKLKYTPKL